jgi:von Willebrand factor type A domain
MTAINAALVQEGRSGIAPARLLDLPADGRAVRVALEAGKLGRGAKGLAIDAGGGRSIAAVVEIALPSAAADKVLLVDGTWETRDGDRVFVARTARFEDADARTRFVFFLTDGYIGNDQGVVAAVRANARASRVFSLGIGESVNRYLLEEMARAGRGVCEVVTLAESADAAIDRLVKRIASPVLTDIRLDVPASLGITEIMPGEDGIPDLFDEEPIVIVGRYKGAASGTITVRGRTGAGAWEKSIPVSLPETEAGHDVVKTLWARAKVDEILRPHLAALESQSVDAATKRSVVRLGESYSIATPFTSFVAVEKSRVVVGGKPMLVAVPVELPSGTTWAGFFGEGGREVPGIAQDASVRPGAAVEWFVQEATQRGLIERPEEQTKGKVSAEADTLSLGVPPGAPGGFSGGAAGGLGGGVAAGTVLNASVAPLQSGPATATYSRDASLSPALRSAAPSAGPSTGTGGERSQDAAVSASRRLSRMKPGRAPSGSSSFDDSSRSFEVDLMLREQVAEGGANAAEPAAGSPQEKADAKPLLSSDELDRLVRVLDRRLVLLAIAQLLGDEDRVRSLGSELGLPMTDGTLLVAIKLDAAAIERVRALGLTVEAADAARGLAVARVPVAGLAKLAATEGIKRVEPVIR